MSPASCERRQLPGGIAGEAIAALDAGALGEALAAHERALATGGDAVLKHDERSRITAVAAGGRRVVVKEVTKGGAARRLADALRGSPARRTFGIARALEAAGIGVATPLAWLERRRGGLPLRSWLLSEDLRPALPAQERAAREPGSAADVLETLCDVAIALHRAGVCHGDLRAQHVFLSSDLSSGPSSSLFSGAGAPKLIDVDSVQGPGPLSEAERIRDLASLNASWADALAPAAARRAAFARYARALPFQDEEAALARIVADSLARDELWRGDDCRLSSRGS